MNLKHQLLGLICSAALAISGISVPMAAAEGQNNPAWQVIYTYSFENWNLTDDLETGAQEASLYPDTESGIRIQPVPEKVVPFSNIDTSELPDLQNTNGFSLPSGKVLAAGPQKGPGSARTLEIYKTPATAPKQTPEGLRIEYDFAMHDLGTAGKLHNEYSLRYTTADGTQYAPLMIPSSTTFTNLGIQAKNVTASKAAPFANVTMDYEMWHHVALEFDFKHGTVAFYLNGEQYKLPVEAPAVTYETLESIALFSYNKEWNDDLAYYDNITVSAVDVMPEPVSKITVDISQTPGEAVLLPQSQVSYTAAVSDSLDRTISEVEFYQNEKLIATVTEAPYTVSVKAPLGESTIRAVARNENGDSGEGIFITRTNTVIPDAVFSDDMIFQRGKPITVSGSGVSGETVTVSFLGRTASAVVTAGVWSVTLPEAEAVKSEDLIISASGGSDTVLKNVAVGEVVLCSGQSNMAYTFNGLRSLDSERDGDYPDIRIYETGAENASWKPALKNDDTYWFSALGYMIGKRLYQTYNGEVPIGVIKAAYDGSSIVQWMHSSSFKQDPDLRAMETGSKDVSKHYNTKIVPALKLSVGSVVWYQGEANTWYSNTAYEKALAALISGWREEFHDPELPFVIIQLPTVNFYRIYGSGRVGIGVREGQWNVSKMLDRVESVVSIDTGQSNNVHPQDKQAIADRTVLHLRHFIEPHNSNILHRSPSFIKAERDGDSMVLYFENTYGALQTNDANPPVGFEVRNDDGEYVPVENPVIDGETIRIDVTGLKNPAVRYAWSDVPGLTKQELIDKKDTKALVNLYNAQMLPMAPFRTDQTEKYQYADYDLIDPGKNTTLTSYTPYITDIKVQKDGDAVVFSVKAGDSDGFINQVELFVDGLPAGFCQQSEDQTVWTLRLPDITDGSHTVYAIARDNDGNTNIQSNQDGGTEIKQPLQTGFRIGEQTTDWSQVFDTYELFTVHEPVLSGDSAAVTKAVPSGYYRQITKLSASENRHSATITLPLEQTPGDGQDILSFEATVYFESDNAAMNATRNIGVITGKGDYLPLYSFTANTLRISGSARYETLKNNLQNDVWYHLKTVLDLKQGSIRVEVNENTYCFNVPWIDSFSSDYDKFAPDQIASLKTGIQGFFVQHTGGTAGVEGATYIDSVCVQIQSYDILESGDIPKPPVTAYKINSVITGGDDITVDVTIPDVLNANAKLYLAVYDENYMLQNVQIAENIINGKNTFIKKDGAVYRAFIWDNMKPLTQAK